MLETPTIQHVGGNSYHATFGSDKNLFARFYLEAVYNEFISVESGHPHYQDEVFIELIMPGSKNTYKEKVALVRGTDGKPIKPYKVLHDNSGTPSYPERFPQQWRQFVSEQEQTHDGLPLKEWPVVTKGQALNLAAKQVHTVEQLAEIPDSNIDVLGLGGRDLRDKAKSYLSRAVSASEITKLYAEIEKLKADNAVMREQLSPSEPKETLKLKGIKNG